MMNEIINIILQLIGAGAIGWVLGKALLRLWRDLRPNEWENPIKRWVKKIVLDYLKELQKD